jgi:hypothetical protein
MARFLQAIIAIVDTVGGKLRLDSGHASYLVLALHVAQLALQIVQVGPAALVALLIALLYVGTTKHRSVGLVRSRGRIFPLIALRSSCRPRRRNCSTSEQP